MEACFLLPTTLRLLQELLLLEVKPLSILLIIFQLLVLILLYFKLVLGLSKAIFHKTFLQEVVRLV